MTAVEPVEVAVQPARAPHSSWRVAARGYPRSVAVGATFSIAWSPCIGPILGVVLTLAATSGTAAQGALLLAAYALGLGVWFLAFGAFFGWLTPRLRRLQPYMPRLLAASGILFILGGTAMALGEFTRLNNYFRSFGFAFEQTAGIEQQLSSNVRGLVGPLVAFLGGMLSFLSPCVLPLVPVYLANLAGEAFQPSNDSAADSRRVFLHAVAFVVGFTVVFALLGALAGLAGAAVGGYLDELTRAGGVLLIVLGLHMSGLVRIPFLDRTYQLPAN